MKKVIVVISLIISALSLLAMTPNKPYVITNGEILFCDNLVEGFSGFKLKFDNKETIKLDLSQVDEFYNNGKYYQRFTIEEEGIDNNFMQIVAVKGNLKLVKLTSYKSIMMDQRNNTIIPGGEFSSFYVFDRDNFLIEVYDEIAENIQLYFSE